MRWAFGLGLGQAPLEVGDFIFEIVVFMTEPGGSVHSGLLVSHMASFLSEGVWFGKEGMLNTIADKLIGLNCLSLIMTINYNAVPSSVHRNHETQINPAMQ